MSGNFDLNQPYAPMVICFAFNNPTNYQVRVMEGKFAGRNLNIGASNLGFSQYGDDKILEAAFSSILSRLKINYPQSSQGRQFSFVEIEIGKDRKMDIKLKDQMGNSQTLEADGDLFFLIASVVRLIQEGIDKEERQVKAFKEVDLSKKPISFEEAKPLSNEGEMKKSGIKQKEQASLFFKNNRTAEEKNFIKESIRQQQKKRLKDEESDIQKKRKEIIRKEIIRENIKDEYLKDDFENRL